MQWLHIAAWSGPLFWAALWALAVTCISLAFYPLSRWRLRHIPGPLGLPLVGTLDRTIRFDLPNFVDQCARQYGTVFKIWFGPMPWVVINDPEVGKRLMSRLLQRPKVLSRLTVLPDHEQKIAVSGLVTMSGAPWRVARKAFESAVMHRSALDLHMEVMQECVERLVSRISRLVSSSGPGVELNISPLMGDLTMDVVGSCVFGVAFNTQENDHETVLPSSHDMPYTGRQLVGACKAVFEMGRMDRASIWVPIATMLPSLHPLIRAVAIRFPGRALRQSIQHRRIINQVSAALLRSYQQAKESNQFSSKLSQRSFLGMLLSGQDLTTGTRLSEDEVVAQAVLFLLAGYETTAATLMFAVYLLALHPEAQSRLHQELDQGREVLRRRVVHAGSGAPVSKAGGGGAVAAAPAGPMDMNGSHPATAAARGDDQKSSSVAAEGSNEAGLNNEEIAKHFPYACGVIEEALRLYPPAAGTSRETPEDMEILGYRIPKGTTVYIPVSTYQLDESQWPRAAEFLPERHMPGREDLGPAAAKSNAFAPFGHGARSCPGSRFALQEARLALVRLFDRFRFELGPSQEVPIKTRTGFTTAPVNGVHVRVFERRPAAA